MNIVPRFNVDATSEGDDDKPTSGNRHLLQYSGTVRHEYYLAIQETAFADMLAMKTKYGVGDRWDLCDFLRVEMHVGVGRY